ncbi:hypothetical protein AKJ09_11433 [Labilithrix luteola]|uniref:Uncharacterized protein n=1 Tax=Labilithrix luteola TaxID=1391654 RepID=A0A0K1QH63_9BACT|nr:hypothetical protein AKJ09_11433 [Labilithrix luteola]
MGVAVSTVALGAHAAHAGEAPRPVHVAVAWTRARGAEACIAPAELVAKTRARAAADTTIDLQQPGADFQVIGRIEPRDGGFRTQLVLRDAVGLRLGDRTLESTTKSCRSLDESLILALALLVEMPSVRAVAEGSAKEELDEILPPWRTDEPAVQEKPVRVTPPAPTSSPWKFEAAVGASVAAGQLPQPTIGPTLSGVLLPPHFVPVALRLTAYPLATERTPLTGEGIAVRGFSGGVDLCPFTFGHSEFEARACAGARLMALHAEPLGPRSTAADQTFLDLPLRAELRARTGSVLPYAALEAHLAPAAGAFVYRDPQGLEQTAFRVPWITVGLEFGLIWRAIP